MRWLWCLVCGLVLAACTPPTQEEINAAYYGPQPSDPIGIAEQWVGDRLIDPYSARYEHRGITQGVLYDIRGDYFGWVQCGTVNARNRMGAYVGRTTYVVVIVDNRVIFGRMDDPTNDYIASARDACRQSPPLQAAPSGRK